MAVEMEFMKLFQDFGKLRGQKPESAKVQEHVKKLQDYITQNFYHCTDEILLTLGRMYAGGGEFTANIDQAGGTGTAEFAAKAIEIYSGRK